MHRRDYSVLLSELVQDYERYAPQSGALNRRAERVMVDGGSHALRLIRPFPPRIAAADGAWLRDEDGHSILDFWQGHFANILGHNPKHITSALVRSLEAGYGLQTGFADRLQVETAELFCRQTGAERVRFTTSGTLATMYAIMLARTYTDRHLVMKVGGGWHGAQPWGLVGVGFRPDGFTGLESGGLPRGVGGEVVVSRFNDIQALEDDFHRHGDRIACLIVEPFMGAGGGLPVHREYLQMARRLTDQYGAVLILDEVVSGFRFRAGDMGSVYGVRPDLATFGKIMGGGMPVSALAGRSAIMDLVGRRGGQRVGFSGGTYSGHPASMLAAREVMTYLAEHEDEVYSQLGDLGRKARQVIESAFAEEGICVRCTGDEDGLPYGSSLVFPHFPYDPDHPLESPEDTLSPAVCDFALVHQVLQLALLLEDVHVLDGLGSLTVVHTEEDIAFLDQAFRRVARRLAPHVA